ncbi:hypothetical protein HY745_13465 [Candidatus Desantisbacteria bacterium]|nr:hypothetical protein [Candidatus Desantisbacteria bacterium]
MFLWEISKIFRVQISQSATSFESEKSTKSKKAGIDISGEIKNEQETKSFTETILEGVTIPETWFDEKTKTHYALAVLDKVKTRVSLANKISDEEETIAAQLKAVEAVSSSIEKIKALTMAINALDAKSALITQKNIVDPVSVQDLNTGTTRAEILSKRDNLLKKIVFIVMKNEETGNKNLREMIKEKITKMGFRIENEMPDKIEADVNVIIIKSSLELQSVDRGDPQWKFFNWTGSIEIIEGKPEGTVLAAISKGGQESHTIEKTAQAKAISSAGKSLADALGDWITAYIFGSKN